MERGAGNYGEMGDGMRAGPKSTALSSSLRGVGTSTRDASETVTRGGEISTSIETGRVLATIAPSATSIAVAVRAQHLSRGPHRSATRRRFATGRLGHSRPTDRAIATAGSGDLAAFVAQFCVVRPDPPELVAPGESWA